LPPILYTIFKHAGIAKVALEIEKIDLDINIYA
jgi:hypothetical protein